MKIKIMAKKTQVSETSIAAYYEIIRSGLVKSEKAQVLALFQKLSQPTNRKQLENITSLPINHLCRILYTLVGESRIVICHDGPCPITKKKVHFYQLAKQAENNTAA